MMMQGNVIGGKSITDFDGNVYNTMTINGKTWMVENLRVTHYRDGSLITGIMQYPGKDQLAGKLYTKTHANTSNIAPVGWHVATYAEWVSVSSGNGFGQLVGLGLMKSSDAGGVCYYGGYIQPTSGWWWLTNEYTGFIFSGEPLVSASGNGYLSQHGTDWGPSHGMSIRCVKD
jgi:hypothetical protein